MGIDLTALSGFVLAAIAGAAGIIRELSARKAARENVDQDNVIFWKELWEKERIRSDTFQERFYSLADNTKRQLDEVEKQEKIG